MQVTLKAIYSREKKMFFRRIFGFIYLIIALSAIANPNYSSANQLLIGSNAVVFAYHRVAENRYPSTNVTLKQFEAHLAELKTGGYNVMALPKIIMSIKAGKSLPDRTVGISFDDAYLSVYNKAWPRLKANGFPFTIFVATDHIGNNATNFMTWAQIQEMDMAGVTIGSHTGSHLHMPIASEQKNISEIERSQKRIAEALNKSPIIFAYPYGETSLKIQSIIEKMGFIAAFGQQSGAFDKTSNLFNLPRYSMNENYASIKRFRLAANTLALQVSDITPADTLLTNDNPPVIGFTLISNLKDLDQLSCFASHTDQTRIELLGNKRIEIRMEENFPEGRTRINCTLPGIQGRWHWFGRQFYRP